jgi:S1-C subfamily serine protease
MTMLFHRLAAPLALLLLLLVPPSSFAAPTPGTVEPEAAVLFGAIVKVATKVPADARTVRSLGPEREGSGVVIDGSGLVLTIGYLMLEAESAEITLAGGRTVPASLVAYDHDTGFGLLRANGPLGVTPVTLGKSSGLGPRDKVLVAPFGGAPMAMPAMVVGRRAYAGSWEYLLENAIFTSPPHPSFGGAGLFDMEGKLVGIGSLIVGDAAGPGRQVPGNMFVPIDRLAPILGDLLERGRSSAPRRPWLGLASEEVRGRLFVVRVSKGGPAHEAGIEVGDMVIGVGGKPVSGLADFYRKVWARGEAGINVPIDILHGTAIAPVTVKSIDRYRWLKLERSY